MVESQMVQGPKVQKSQEDSGEGEKDFMSEGKLEDGGQQRLKNSKT